MDIKEAPKSTSTHSLLVVEKGVRFVCPNCGKGVIIRTNKERKMGVKWICPSCGFEGP